MEWLAYVWLFTIPLIFLVLVLWIFRPSGRKRYRKDGEIPFHESDSHHRPAG